MSIPNPVCEECGGTGVINLGDDCDYSCPVCVGANRIVGYDPATDSAVIEDKITPLER